MFSLVGAVRKLQQHVQKQSIDYLFLLQHLNQ